MKRNVLWLFLLIQAFCFAQETWRPLGDDDFNRATRGEVTLAGRYPIVIRNEHVFLFNIENPDYQSTNYHFSIGKYTGTQWEHIGFPFLFSSTPTMDCAVGNDEIPYVIYNDVSAGNLPIVKKFEDGNWTDVGTGISTLSSSFFNIAIGTDNLPRILFSEGSLIKLKKFDGTNWNLISQTTEFIPYTSISLELDKNNLPYVLTNYQVGSTYNCFVKKFNGAAWEEVGITGFAESGRSLVFNSLNVPYMYVGSKIKSFNGSTWENIPAPFPGISMLAVMSPLNLFFSNSDDLYATFAGKLYTNPIVIYVMKLVGSTWQTIINNGFINDQVYGFSGDNLYHVSIVPSLQPKVYKYTGTQSTVLGNQNNISGNGNHDFSICNGIPLVAYVGPSYKAAVSMFSDNTWTVLGGLYISENEISMPVIKSGTDGTIYLAYNNKLSTTAGDTKITVKKLTASGWTPVGPVNFSLSAGELFDFKVSHTNEPYVLYMSGRVQKFDGTNWVFIGGSAYTGDTDARLALDTNDIPYIALIDPSNSGHIAVKKLNGTAWEYVDQAGLSAYTSYEYRARIVVDELNTIYLGFTDSAKKIHIKKLNNGAWESVGSDLFSNGSTDQFELAVDHNNVLYLAYNELQNSFRTEAKVKRFNGSSWEYVGEPNFSPTSIVQGKIDFSENNTPMVSYSSAISSYRDISTRYFGELNALGINEHQLDSGSQKWILSPNPVTNTFSIEGNDQIQLLEIYDLTGKKILTDTTNSTNIDVSFFCSGIYVVKIKTDNGISAVKLIKN